MKIKYFKFFTILILFSGFLFFNGIVLAEEAPDSAPALTQDADSIAKEKESVPQEVLQDLEVSIEDLGADKASILPDSKLHIFKRIGWKMSEALTFDPIKDAQLKLKHANQQLAETKQLIDKKGIENIDPKIVSNSINNFENKLKKVKNTKKALKNVNSDKTKEVDKFLDEITDKQLKQQKMLDNIGKQAMDIAKKTDSNNMESLIGQVHETKEQALDDFTEMIVQVDEQGDAIAKRIENAMAKESGSSFKPLKHLEFLDAVYNKVPETAKQAIQKAKTNAIEQFEKRINEMPETMRTEKLQSYIKNTTGDETRLFSLLDEIKNSPTLPSDVLAKIEKVKEIVVQRFENKMQRVSAPDIKQKFLNGFNTNDAVGLIALEEFKNRMNQDTEEFRLIEQEHEKSAKAFREKFSDAKSQEQVKLFEKLSKEMLENPSPKTFKLLNELEQEVRQDPEKQAFLDQMEQEMQGKMQDRFNREGDKFMDRMTTLDPNDINFLEKMDFSPEFEGKFIDRNAQHFKDYMQDIHEPEEFDRFQERFFNVPDFVVDEIKRYDGEFEDTMQFKMRKMEEIKAEQERNIARSTLDYEEREMHHQLDRLQQKKEQEFWEKFDNIPWDDFNARQKMWQEKIKNSQDMAEQKFNERKNIFQKRLELDPWCDESCQKIQYQFIEQDYRHEKERLADDLVRERNRMELEKARHKQENPLYEKCKDGQDCEKYCKNNPGIKGCEWVMPEPGQKQCDAPAWWDFGRQECVHPKEIAPDCAKGHYWDMEAKTCVRDPYWEPPKKFKECGPDMFWNEEEGYCKRKKIEPYCGDGNCNKNEDKWSCSKDCGPSCPKNEYNNYTGETMCNYDKCASGCKNDSQGCPNECYEDVKDLCDKGPKMCESEAECRARDGYYWCRDAKCYREPCAVETFCGNGICEQDETDNNCASDCALNIPEKNIPETMPKPEIPEEVITIPETTKTEINNTREELNTDTQNNIEYMEPEIYKPEPTEIYDFPVQEPEPTRTQDNIIDNTNNTGAGIWGVIKNLFGF